MNNRVLPVLALACLGLPPAQGLAAESGGWQFEATPYLFASGLDGTVGVSGFTTEVDASFSDILENLDGGFMGLFTARKGPWLVGLEGVYMRLEGDVSRTVTGPGGVVSVDGRLDVTNKLYVVQGSAGYRVLDDRTKVNLVGAARWTKLDADLTVEVQFTPASCSQAAVSVRTAAKAGPTSSSARRWCIPSATPWPCMATRISARVVLT
jgi:hypothetical protein